MGSAPDPDAGERPDISQALRLLAALIARAHRSHLSRERHDLLDVRRNDADEVDGKPGADDEVGP